MEVLMTILYALVIVVAILLAILILIQPSKSGGLGATFGGVGESVFGARAGSHLTKATVALTVTFFVLALLLAALIGHSKKSVSTGEEIAAEDAKGLTVKVDAKAPAAAPAKAPAKAPAAK